MFKDIKEAISYIETRGGKHQLDWYKEFLKKIKIEYNHHKFIHVTGTNGKGSTVNYIANILINSGYRVGTFTSPYLLVHNDRIRINNKNISDEELLRYINKYCEIIDENKLSMFEIDLLIALEYFTLNEVDFVILEVGIGGTLDKTNIIENPLVSVITSVGEDHLDLLGPTILDIAKNKAGIIKRNGIVITPKVTDKYYDIITDKARKENAHLIEVEVPTNSDFPIEFEYQNQNYKLGDVGLYQISNACLAIEAVRALIRYHIIIKEDIIRESLLNTTWSGRFERCTYAGKEFYLDGAHNVHGIKALVDSIEHKKGDRKVCIIFSALADKKYDEMIDLLKPVCDKLIITTFDDSRKMDISLFENRNDLNVVENFEEALDSALLGDYFVVVTGSLHFVSSVKKVIL